MTKCGECSHSHYCSADHMIKGNDFLDVSCYSAINGAFVKIFDKLFSLNIVEILYLNGKKPKTWKIGNNYFSSAINLSKYPNKSRSLDEFGNESFVEKTGWNVIERNTARQRDWEKTERNTTRQSKIERDRVR